MAFTKITAAGIGSTETVTLDGLSVINDVSIGGTLTYEDVTNVDSFGLITARNGIVVGSGITLSKDGDGFFTGIVTATSFVGSGAELTGVASTENIRTNTNATFLQNVTVVGTSTVTGNVVPSSDSATDIGTNSVRFQNAYVDTYYGDGSNLTGIAATANVRTGILDVAGIATFRDNVNVPNLNSGQLAGRRNLIINGAMAVAQRGTSSSTTGYRTVDRFKLRGANTDQWALTQSQEDVAVNEAPYNTDGHRKYYDIQTTTVETSNIGSNEYVDIFQRIEAYNTYHLGYGQSGGTAKTLTLSFWVRAYQTGTYVFYIYLSGGKMQTKTYTVNASNTWEKKTIVIEPDGADAQTPSTSYSLQVGWLLAAGSDYTGGSNSTSYITYADTNFAAGQTADITSSTNNFFHLTGVQLEIGSQATAFEHHSFHEDRLLCQRYYQEIEGNSDVVMWGSGRASTSQNALVNTPLSVPLRASPTISQTSYTTWGTAGSHSVDNETPTVQYFSANNTFLPMNFHSTASLSNARVATVACRDGSSLVMDAEL